MLEQLIAEIRAGGTLEVNSLAKKLGASPQLVSVMLEHLQRSGYIRPYQTCGDGCGDCSLKTDCNHAERVDLLKMWQG